MAQSAMRLIYVGRLIIKINSYIQFMKNSKKIAPIIAALMLVAVTAPAYALDVGVMTNTDLKVEDGRMYKGNDNDRNDDRKGSLTVSTDAKARAEIEMRNGLYNHMKSWIISTGTVGQVTAVATGSITIKTSNSEIFTVTTTDATIRRGENNSSTALTVGETIYVLGVKNGTNIVASAIVAGKTKDDVKPTTEEKRQAYLGVITAKTDAALTILGSNNVSYSVTLASGSQIWINKSKQANLSNFAVGNNIMVQGTLSGTNISAKSLMVINLPLGTVVGKITAINGTTLTISGSDSKSYTVLVANADIKAKGEKDSKLSNLTVGDSVLVKGDLNGTTITAKSVTEENIKVGFFHRFGLFFKSIFSKK